MLEVSGIDCFYGKVQVLRGLNLVARPGEVTCLMGRNGAGKSTTLKAIMGLQPISTGTVSLGGERLDNLPAHEVPKRGIGYVPQGRRLFAEMSVAENIEIGLMTRGRGEAVREKVLDLFPRLRERLSQRAGTMSGGEQQMLAMARALCVEPTVLLLDEPTEGLQPSMISLIRDVVSRLKSMDVAIVLVEQRVEAVMALADRVAFVENGHSREVVAVSDLTPKSDILRKYVGV